MGPTSAFKSAHWTCTILVSEPILPTNIAQPSGVIRILRPLKTNPHPPFKAVTLKLWNSEPSQGHNVKIAGHWEEDFLCFHQNIRLSSPPFISYVEEEMKLHIGKHRHAIFFSPSIISTSGMYLHHMTPDLRYWEKYVTWRHWHSQQKSITCSICEKASSKSKLRDIRGCARVWLTHTAQESWPCMVLSNGTFSNTLVLVTWRQPWREYLHCKNWKCYIAGLFQTDIC